MSRFARLWRFPMLVLLALSLSMTACGRRPDNVSAPSSGQTIDGEPVEEIDNFPRRYPTY